LLLLVVPWSLIASQDKKPGKDGKSQPIFRLPVNVVVVNATVTDKKGNPVTGLQQSDFKIYEDGKLQPIDTFAEESYLADQELAAGSRSLATQDAALPRLPPSVPATRPRMISIFIDDLTMDSIDFYPSLIKVLQDYVANDVGPQDHVGILLGSGRLQFPFSDDKQLLSETISGLLGKLNLAMRYRSRFDITDLQAYRIAVLGDEGELTNSGATISPMAIQEATAQYQDAEYRAIGLLDTMRRNIRSMKHFDAEKSVLILSLGFLSYIGCPSCVVPNQLQEIIDLALNSGVVLNCVNLRGLDSGMSADPHAPKQTDAIDDMVAREDPLFQLSYDTGGVFFHNDNNLYKGIKQIIHRQSQYYILTYATPSQKADGSYHRIKVEVSRPGLEISYRKGYYTPREEMTFERRKREDIIDALQAPGNLNEIPVTLSYNCYRNDSSTYGVSFLTNVDIRKVHFLDEDARRKNLISLVLAAYDDHGKFIDGLEKTIDLKLLESSYAGVLKQGLSSRVELKLPFGRYKIKTVVRESVQGKIGSLTKAIEVP
jgi:VWFA-related protein